jgi:hypothetical protein
MSGIRLARQAAGGGLGWASLWSSRLPAAQKPQQIAFLCGGAASQPSCQARAWKQASNTAAVWRSAGLEPRTALNQAATGLRASMSRFMHSSTPDSAANGERTMSTAAAAAAGTQAPSPAAPAPVEKSMFFVVRILGKQHKVCEMDTITTDHLVGKKIGETSRILWNAVYHEVLNRVLCGRGNCYFE